MKVQVTQEDIDEGTPRSSTHCPIARALIRLLPEAKISVGRIRIHINETFILVPIAAFEFMKVFDRLGSGAPFEFELEVPE